MTTPLGLETKAQRCIFVTYIGLWVSYGMLSELAKRQGVHFNSACAVVLQSLLKLLLATYMYMTTETITTSSLAARIRFMLAQVRTHARLILFYIIPSGLYVVYDVLSYINLRAFDASTYFLLMQFRLVVTGVLHQLMFSKRLNRNQWLSLGVITIGCTIKTLSTQDTDGSARFGVNYNGPRPVAYLLLLTQILSGTFAGVYNEVLLKKQVAITVNLQNVFMYFNSIIGTMIMLGMGMTGQTAQDALTISNFSELFSPYVLPMVLIMSFTGIVTSLFLKQLDSIRKAIASAMELVFLPLLCAVLFGQLITLYTMAAIVFVGFGVYLYALPVKVLSTAELPKYRKVTHQEMVQDENDSLDTPIDVAESPSAVNRLRC
ncbi:hypothetical protein CCR75_001198 [Bremia lactucae]|uniref:CMP-sialic acid transporter n=1 Tax=Bremia lactucae TaxID=4779 RepID=A0A976IGD3_BRELC|nr:hypothetical protein CCR75_001198 [Bremia lactucae]